MAVVTHHSLFLPPCLSFGTLPISVRTVSQVRFGGTPGKYNVVGTKTREKIRKFLTPLWDCSFYQGRMGLKDPRNRVVLEERGTAFYSNVSYSIPLPHRLSLRIRSGRVAKLV